MSAETAHNITKTHKLPMTQYSIILRHTNEKLFHLQTKKTEQGNLVLILPVLIPALSQDGTSTNKRKIFEILFVMGVTSLFSLCPVAIFFREVMVFALLCAGGVPVGLVGGRLHGLNA